MTARRKWSEADRTLIAEMRSRRATKPEIAAALGCSFRAAKSYVDRMVKAGSLAPQEYAPIIERLRAGSIVNPVTDCHEWQRHRDRKGYGHVGFESKGELAHRVAYRVFVGPIPVGLVIDHLCRNPCCINPQHLEPVTTQENTRRGTKPNQMHCLKGHLFDEANTYFTPMGRRSCRACNREAEARRRARLRCADRAVAP